ncbi:MAG TPA: hypothetical protein ENN60_00645 [archaeon]|nr:hypothetical protein [archaeon]
MDGKTIRNGLGVIVVTAITSLVLVLLAILYFGVTLWTIKAASTWFFGTGLDANWAVLSAAIVAAASVLAGAIEKKSF